MIRQSTLEMLKHHEGVRLKPYRCPARLWTVGVGHVIDPSHIKVPFADRMALELPKAWDRTMTLAEVDKLLQDDLKRFEDGVLRLCPASRTNVGHFEALVGFSFNVGLGNLQNSTLRMKYNRADYDGAADEFLKWDKAGGKVLPGLTKRRQDERLLFLKG